MDFDQLLETRINSSIDQFTKAAVKLEGYISFIQNFRIKLFVMKLYLFKQLLQIVIIIMVELKKIVVIIIKIEGFELFD